LLLELGAEVPMAADASGDGERKGGARWAVGIASALALATAGCGGGQGLGLPCQDSVDGYCLGAGNCPRTWTEAQDVLLVCQYGIDRSIPVCGGYRVVVAQGVDTGLRYYYDPRTGALAAIVSYGFPGEMCLGGPGTFLVPSCDGAPSAVLDCPTS
jgi:hypothetical protein